ADVQDVDPLAHRIRQPAAAIAGDVAVGLGRAGPAGGWRRALRGVRRVDRAGAFAVAAAFQAADTDARIGRAAVDVGDAAAAIAGVAVAVRPRTAGPPGRRRRHLAVRVRDRIDEAGAARH